MRRLKNNTLLDSIRRLATRGWPVQAVAAVVAASILETAPAHALVIELIDVGSTPMRAEQLAAFREAADKWEAQFSDPITVKINVSFAALKSGVLGETIVAFTTHPYSNVRAAMLFNAETSDEHAVVDQLPRGRVPV